MQHRWSQLCSMFLQLLIHWKCLGVAAISYCVKYSTVLSDGDLIAHKLFLLHLQACIPVINQTVKSMPLCLYQLLVAYNTCHCIKTVIKGAIHYSPTTDILNPFITIASLHQFGENEEDKGVAVVICEGIPHPWFIFHRSAFHKLVILISL